MFELTPGESLSLRSQSVILEMKRKFKDINEALHDLLNPKSKPVEIGLNKKREQNRKLLHRLFLYRQ
jgi:hypothetical protein